MRLKKPYENRIKVLLKELKSVEKDRRLHGINIIKTEKLYVKASQKMDNISAKILYLEGLIEDRQLKRL